PTRRCSDLAGVGSNDRGTLILSASRAEAASPTTMDRDELRSALRGVEPGPRTTRYAPALRYAQRLLANSPLPRREVVLISDFQRSGWDADAAEAESIHLPEGTTVRPVSVVGGAGSNVAVASLAVERSVTEGIERATLSARLISSGEAPTRPLPVVLEVNGRPVETKEVALDGLSG